MDIIEVWAADPDLDFGSMVISREIRSRQQPMIVLGIGGRHLSGKASYPHRERIIVCPVNEVTGLNIELVNGFVRAVKGRWIELQREYSGRTFNMWFRLVNGGCEPVEVADGSTYLTRGWENFRIYLMQTVLEQFETDVPSFTVGGVGGATHH